MAQTPSSASQVSGERMRMEQRRSSIVGFALVDELVLRGQALRRPGMQDFIRDTARTRSASEETTHRR